MPFDEGLTKVILTKVEVGDSEPSRANAVFRTIKRRPPITSPKPDGARGRSIAI